MSDALPKKNKNHSASVLTRFIKRKAKRGLKQGRQAIEHLATIQEMKDELELLSNFSTDTVYRLNYETMTYSYVSPNVSKLLGYNVDEIKHMNVRTLIIETRLIDEGMKQVESYAGLELMRKNREVQKWQADYLMRTKDGRKIWVSDVSYPWHDKQGKLLGSVGSLRDVTDRIYAEQQMKEAVTELVSRDVLTGLPMRKQFFVKLEDEVKRTRRSGKDAALLMIDIDKFNALNQTHTSEFGDFVLQELTKLMLSCLRETDMAARVDGEEFAIVLPDTGAEGAYWVAERIRTTVNSHQFISRHSAQPVKVSLSIGVATSRDTQDLDAGMLLNLAEQRVYQAKQKGRNQVVTGEIVEQLGVLH
jgi:diguanylate cyclase (GGDEF)-like protein/PAS domain S-box-containing protein